MLEPNKNTKKMSEKSNFFPEDTKPQISAAAAAAAAADAAAAAAAGVRILIV